MEASLFETDDDEWDRHDKADRWWITFTISTVQLDWVVDLERSKHSIVRNLINQIEGGIHWNTIHLIWTRIYVSGKKHDI